MAIYGQAIDKHINMRDITNIIVDINIVFNDILLCCVVSKYDRLLVRIFNEWEIIDINIAINFDCMYLREPTLWTLLN